jgi:hypothetical protein
MNRGRVGEERGGKKMDGCPLTIDSNVSRHLWPLVASRYHFEGLKVACMSSDACIMMLLHDVMSKLSVFGDIDLASEHE